MSHQKNSTKILNIETSNISSTHLLAKQKSISKYDENLKKSNQKTNVLMFGPCLLEQGGMGAVQKHIVDNAPKEVNIRHITTWNGKSSTLILFTKALIAFVFQIFKNQVDIVHIHVSERGSVLRKSILAVLAFAFSKPVLMHTHGCEFHIFYDNLPTIAKQLLNKVWQNCDKIIVLSKSWEQIYTKKCNLAADKVFVKYNPVVVPRNVPSKNNSNKITFLLVGKISQRKGVFDLLKIVPEEWGSE